MRLVITGAHTGLKKAISTVFHGAAWQRYRLHFMRNVLAIVSKGSQDMVASIIRTIFVIRTIFARPDAAHVNAQFDEVARMLSRPHPKVAAMLDDARSNLLAFAGLLQRYWPQVRSRNPLERVNKGIKRRTDVVGAFPNPTAPCGWLAPSWSSSTTSGKPATAATSRGLHAGVDDNDRHRPRAHQISDSHL